MNKNNIVKDINSSFRDPSGFVFCQENKIFRQINFFYKKSYDLFIESGLYEKLNKENLIVKHSEVDDLESFPESKERYKIIQAEKIDFISYPHEWCFSQLRDAALLTLKIQKISLEFGMTLKDASSYNIQFKNNETIFIDTLSFEKYEKNNTWVAYRQFCQHFLAPLALMYYSDTRMNQLFRTNIDGVPLDLANKLLPLKAKFSFSIFTHIYLQSKMQNYFADKKITTKHSSSKKSLLALLDSLETSIKKMKWIESKSEWGKYYTFTNYSKEANDSKRLLLEKYLQIIKPKKVWDLGANNGEFSRIASNNGISTCSFDIDYNAVEKNYQKIKKGKEKNILPLFIDLTNPSPAIGWAHTERMSLTERGPVDMVFALALIHHLAISNNLPFLNIAKYFSSICKSLIIEFVPKNDSKVEILLSSRKDIFLSYHQKGFEDSFRKYFDIEEVNEIKNSERILYLMKSRRFS